MTPQRATALERGQAELTTEEKAEGWHFCNEWDGMLVHPDSPEAEACDCPLRHPVKSSESAEFITLRGRIDELIAQHGTLRATARVLMTDCGYLHRLRAGEKTEPGDPLLRRMGLREVRLYQRAGGPDAAGSSTEAQP